MGIGEAAGPFIVGALNDLFAPEFGDHAIRYSLMVVSAAAFLATPLFYLGSRTLQADLERARS